MVHPSCRAASLAALALVCSTSFAQAETDLGKSEYMSNWGSTYRSRAMWQPDTAAAPEWYVRGRIVALIDYLGRIQEK